MVIAVNPSSNFVDNKDFNDYVTYLRPEVYLPKRPKLRGLLDKHNKLVEQLLLPGLAPKTKVSLALDGRSSTYCHSSFSITCYYIADDCKLKEVLLDIEEVDGLHTCWNLAWMVEKILLSYHRTDRLRAITADNASNNSSLCQNLAAALQSKSINRNLDTMTVNCLTYILKLSAKAVLQQLGSGVLSGQENAEDNYEHAEVEWVSSIVLRMMTSCLTWQHLLERKWVTQF
jgi:hypothetical protein